MRQAEDSRLMERAYRAVCLDGIGKIVRKGAMAWSSGAERSRRTES